MPMGSCPTIDTAELREALEPAFQRHFGLALPITRIDRRPSPYRTSFVMEELDVYLNGTVLHLMLKNVNAQSLTEQARHAKPDFLYDPAREIEVYRAILPSLGLGTAQCYAAAVDEKAQRHWLILEKVDGLELYQIGDFSVWQQVARWLATLHLQFLDFPGLVADCKSLLVYDAAYYSRWMDRAMRFVNPADARFIASEWSEFQKLANRYGEVVASLAKMPATLLHGEFYPSNILVQHSETAARVCPVDWELAALGPPLIDLAAFVAGSWSEEDKSQLAMAYYETLPVDCAWRLEWDDFNKALDVCRLHLAVQWLGWSQGWSPPREHSHNWMREALSLATKLKLVT